MTQKQRCEFVSLIPDAGHAEVALEANLNEKYCRNDATIIQQLHDPWTCPAAFLPWLAYALSVDVWNPQWPEVTQRTVCANALQVHLHKGTRGGLEDALDVLGVTAEISEWWQQEPKGEPGTMQLTLWLRDNIQPNASVILGHTLVTDLRRQIERSKRASIHYTVKLGAALSTPLSIVTSMQAATHMELAAPIKTAQVNSQTHYQLAHSAQVATQMTMQLRQNGMRLDSLCQFVTGLSIHISTITHLDFTGGIA